MKTLSICVFLSVKAFYHLIISKHDAQRWKNFASFSMILLFQLTSSMVYIGFGLLSHWTSSLDILIQVRYLFSRRAGKNTTYSWQSDARLAYCSLSFILSSPGIDAIVLHHPWEMNSVDELVSNRRSQLWYHSASLCPCLSQYLQQHIRHVSYPKIIVARYCLVNIYLGRDVTTGSLAVSFNFAYIRIASQSPGGSGKHSILWRFLCLLGLNFYHKSATAIFASNFIIVDVTSLTTTGSMAHLRFRTQAVICSKVSLYSPHSIAGANIIVSIHTLIFPARTQPAALHPSWLEFFLPSSMWPRHSHQIPFSCFISSPSQLLWKSDMQIPVYKEAPRFQSEPATPPSP